MSALDGPMRAVAKTLTRTFGKDGTLTYEATGAYNPTTGLAPTGTDDSVTLTGPVESFSEREIDGTLVRRDDVKWTVPASGVTKPRVNDSVALDGHSYTVQNVKPVMSGDLAALYELQLRR